MNEKVIYFSLNEDRRQSFYEFVGDEICYTQKFSFSLEGDNSFGGDTNKQKSAQTPLSKDHKDLIPLFKDPRDLIPIIENCKKKDSLHVIIDYVSCCSFEKIDNYAEVIRDIIMAYPEVQFLFDETFVTRSKKEKPENHFCFLNFLFMDAGIRDGKLEIAVVKDQEITETKKIQVLTDFHQFNISKKEDIETQFIRLLKGRNNMFDGSNLRCAIRTYKLVKKIKVQDNFAKITESRRDHLAIDIEEEYQQSMFNGYCLYANGYRVIPIMTVTELKWFNNNIVAANTASKDAQKAASSGDEAAADEAAPADQKAADDSKKDPKTIVVRDYDLQFIDEDKCRTNDNNIPIKNNGKSVSFSEIDLIRGAKDCSEKKDKNGNRMYDWDFVLTVGGDIANPYWSNLLSFPTFFVSKGGKKLRVRWWCVKKNPAMNLSVRKKKLLLYGIQKPIEGIYVSMQEFKHVKKRYKDTVYGIIRKKRNKYGIEIRRRGEDGHSCPLDIYGIARSMVNRAELYYRFGRPRLAALMANEALEILNGFHMSLMKQAYYIKAVSENAMAMSLLGGDEALLCEDLIFRMKKVRKEVNRLVQDNEDRENLLMNIYNDCRLFCREKEYLKAADDALSYMMRDTEGWNLFAKIRNLFS